AIQNFDNKHKAFLPRMWSHEHAKNYLSFIGGLKFSIKPQYRSEAEFVKEVDLFLNAYEQGMLDVEDYDYFLSHYSEFLDIEKPGFGQNMRYMVDYQFGYLYLRYFMWNFA